MSLVPDQVDALIHRAAQTFVTVDDTTREVDGRVVHIHTQITMVAEKLDHAAVYGFLPLALALLILHEHYRATSEGGLFRLGHVAARSVAVVGLLLGYGRIVGLLTGVAGAGGGWMTGDDFSRRIGNVGEQIHQAWWSCGGLDDLGDFLAILFIWSVTVFCAFLAFVSNLLLSKCQAILIMIFLAAGKTCITVSLVPGVGVGKSWARALAQVAGWSFVAGILLTNLAPRAGHTKSLIGADLATVDYLALLRLAGGYLVLTVFTLAVPKITSSLFSGAVGAAPGVMGALAMGFAGAKMLSGDVKSHVRNEKRKAAALEKREAATERYQQRGVEMDAAWAESRRVHKVALSQGDGGPSGSGNTGGLGSGDNDAGARAARDSAMRGSGQSSNEIAQERSAPGRDQHDAEGDSPGSSGSNEGGDADLVHARRSPSPGDVTRGGSPRASGSRGPEASADSDDAIEARAPEGSVATSNPRPARVGNASPRAAEPHAPRASGDPRIAIPIASVSGASRTSAPVAPAPRVAAPAESPTPAAAYPRAMLESAAGDARMSSSPKPTSPSTAAPPSPSHALGGGSVSADRPLSAGRPTSAAPEPRRVSAHVIPRVPAAKHEAPTSPGREAEAPPPPVRDGGERA